MTVVDPKRKIGPNLKKLMAHKMAIDAVPPGGGLWSAIEVLMSTEKMRENAQRALEWALLSINAVRCAIDNPYGDDEETIAGAILQKIEERKAAQALALKK